MLQWNFWVADMLSPAAIDDLAAELHRARSAVSTIGQPSQRFGGMSVADAYAVQRAGVELLLADGREIVGRKIGLTSMAMQRAMGIDEPDYGVITDDMIFADGSGIPAGLFIFPRVEIELAFVLADDLKGVDVEDGDVIRATSYLAPAIEILDSRVEMTAANGHRRTIIDTIADNAADAGLVLGAHRIDPSTLRPREVGGELWINDIIEETGLASAVLGHPVRGVTWLCRTLAQYGEGLKAGQIVLSGSLTQSIAVRAGDTVTADFGRNGQVSCRFI